MPPPILNAGGDLVSRNYVSNLGPNDEQKTISQAG